MTESKLLVVNDTNIFIDLIELGLYREFMQLGHTVHTNIFVLNELKELHQKEIIEKVGGLIIEQFDSPNFQEEILQFYDERTRRGLSFPDCTVLYQGIKLSATVLTGDRKMIKSAKELDVDVHGIIYIFDRLVATELITHTVAHEKLKALYERNRRLPAKEIEKRLELWSKSI